VPDCRVHFRHETLEAEISLVMTACQVPLNGNARQQQQFQAHLQQQHQLHQQQMHQQYQNQHPNQHSNDLPPFLIPSTPSSFGASKTTDIFELHRIGLSLAPARSVYTPSVAAASVHSPVLGHGGDDDDDDADDAYERASGASDNEHHQMQRDESDSDSNEDK
jgi:hypothetical protein